MKFKLKLEDKKSLQYVSLKYEEISNITKKFWKIYGYESSNRLQMEFLIKLTCFEVMKPVIIISRNLLQDVLKDKNLSN